MRFSLRMFFLTISVCSLMITISCNKDDKSTIVQSGMQIEEFESGVLNALPIIGYLQTGSPTYPVLDGDGKDLIWHETEAYEVPTSKENGAGPTVSLKALYDNYYVFLLAEWDDDSHSMHKDFWWYGEPGIGDTTYIANSDYQWHRISSLWEGYVGKIDKIKIDTTVTPRDTTFIFEYEKREFSGNEDGLAFMFNVNSTNFLNCTNFCHGTSMKTDAAETADIWYWHSALSSPRNYVDDQSLSSEGFVADAGNPIFKKNEKDGLPNYVTAQDPGANVGILYDSTAVQYYGTLKWFGSNYTPGYVIQKSEGSRGDIRAVATYSAGKWTVEIRRALNTLVTDGTDIIFNPGTEASLEFHLAVYDNASGKDHAISQDVHLIRFLQYNQ